MPLFMLSITKFNTPQKSFLQWLSQVLWSLRNLRSIQLFLSSVENESQRASEMVARLRRDRRTLRPKVCGRLRLLFGQFATVKYVSQSRVIFRFVWSRLAKWWGPIWFPFLFLRVKQAQLLLLMMLLLAGFRPRPLRKTPLPKTSERIIRENQFYSCCKEGRGELDCSARLLGTTISNL